MWLSVVKWAAIVAVVEAIFCVLWYLLLAGRREGT